MKYIDEETDDVFQNKSSGLWHFWDENGRYFYGPYVTKEEAQIAREDHLCMRAGNA